MSAVKRQSHWDLKMLLLNVYPKIQLVFLFSDVTLELFVPCAMHCGSKMYIKNQSFTTYANCLECTLFYISQNLHRVSI